MLSLKNVSGNYYRSALEERLAVNRSGKIHSYYSRGNDARSPLPSRLGSDTELMSMWHVVDLAIGNLW